jgi:molecular chaperone DnaK
MVFQCEKMLADNGDKFEEADKTDINAKIDELKEALKGEDIELIKAKQEALTAKFYEISEKLYKAAGGAQGFDPNMAGAGFDPNAAGAQGDNYTEAPFTDVD